MRSTVIIMILGAFGVAACKKMSVGSAQLHESGGAAVNWSMEATFDPNGSLYIAAQGPDSELDQYTFTGAKLQVATAPNGQVYGSALTEKKFFALQSGTANLTFNVLVSTRGGQTCYINGARLDGTGYAVACGTGLDTDTGADERKRLELAEACQRLSIQRIDGASSNDYYARYEKDRNRLACTCLNGGTRDVDYARFASKYVSDFEDECRLRGGGGVNPSVAGLSAAQKAELVGRECRSLESRRGVTCQAAAAICGERTKKQLNFDDYNGQSATFRADCLRELDADGPVAGDATALGKLQRACRDEITGATLSTDSRYCNCPGGKRVALDAYLSRLDAFGDACL